MSNLPTQTDPLDPAGGITAEAAASARTLDYATPSTPETDANAHRAERTRRIRLSLLTSLLFRPLAFITPMIAIPLFLRYLGNARYGLYESVAALAAWLGMSNLG